MTPNRPRTPGRPRPIARRAAIVPALILLGMTLAAPRASAESKLLGSWNFENNYLDSSGNGHDLTPSSSPAPSFVAGVTGGTSAIAFASGSSATATNFLGPANDFTLDFDFKTNMATGNAEMINTFNHSTGGWNIVLRDGKLLFNTRDPSLPSGQFITTQNTYADGLWHHVTATMSGTNYLTLEIDHSEFVSGQGQAIPASRLALTFGNSAGGTASNFYNGALDQVRLYSGTGIVPEPSSLLLTGLGLFGGLGLAALRRRA